MPNYVNNAPLGSAFGGKIATLNYNYSPNEGPSSATITIVSENNRYIEPILLSNFNIPILNIPMVIVEVQYNDDSTARTLQIELIDKTSLYLDTNLILVNGVHSSGVEGNSSSSNSFHFYPKTTGTINNNSFGNKGRLSITSGGSGGRNCRYIGGLRSTVKVSSAWDGDTQLFKNNTQPYTTVVFQDNKFRQDLSGKKAGSILPIFQKFGDTSNFEVSNEWGYTFNQLCNNISIPIRNKPNINDNYYFNQAGTCRSVLSGVLSSLGKSFYINPFDGSINIIDNGFINQINRTLSLKYTSLLKESFSDNSITSINIKKSCKETTGRHTVLTGSYENNVDKSGGGGSGDTNIPDKPQYRTFYKYSNVDVISPSERKFFQKILPLFWFNFSQRSVDDFIYALAKLEDPTTWSEKSGDESIYSGNTDSNGNTMIDKTNPKATLRPSDLNKSGEDLEALLSSEYISIMLENISSGNIPDKFDLNQEIDIYPNTRRAKVGENFTLNAAAVSPYEKISPYIEGINMALFTLHVTKPISKKKALSMNWASPSSGQKDPINNNIKIAGPYASDTKISDIPELAPLNFILSRFGKETKITIGKMAKDAAGNFRSNQSGDVSTGYHFIAIKDIAAILPKNLGTIPNDIIKSIEMNVFSSAPINESSTGPILALTKRGQTSIKNIAEKNAQIFQEIVDNIRRSTNTNFRIPYTKLDENDASYEYPDNTASEPELPEVKSIRTIPTKQPTSGDAGMTKIELDTYQGSIEDLSYIDDSFFKETPGPSFEASITFFRPPIKSDLDVFSGLSSISCSFKGDGVETNVSYSTRNYLNMDKSLVQQLTRGSSIPAPRFGPNFINKPAFIKNRKS
jgi:hypothetical protein